MTRINTKLAKQRRRKTKISITTRHPMKISIMSISPKRRKMKFFDVENAEQARNSTKKLSSERRWG